MILVILVTLLVFFSIILWRYGFVSFDFWIVKFTLIIFSVVLVSAWSIIARISESKWKNLEYWNNVVLRISGRSPEQVREVPVLFFLLPFGSQYQSIFKGINGQNFQTWNLMENDVCFIYPQPTFTCSKPTMETLEQWRHSGVRIVNFEHISNIVLVFSLLILNNWMSTWVVYFCVRAKKSEGLETLLGKITPRFNNCGLETIGVRIIVF